MDSYLSILSLRSFVVIYCFLLLAQNVSGQQLLNQQNNQLPGSASAASASVSQPSRLKSSQVTYDQYKSSALYVEPFDLQVLSLPEPQLAFVRQTVAEDILLYREILNEAIETRNKFAPSMKLMLKYSGKLLSKIIKNHLAERQIAPRIEPKPEFFSMVADLIERVVDRSGQLKNERGYSKANIDTEAFRVRVEQVFSYVQKVVEQAPMAAYIRWDSMRLFKDEPLSAHFNSDVVEEMGDVFAIFRGMGYESSSFVARRIVNLLRMFARGITPNSEKDV